MELFKFDYKPFVAINLPRNRNKTTRTPSYIVKFPFLIISQRIHAKLNVKIYFARNIIIF